MVMNKLLVALAAASTLGLSVATFAQNGSTIGCPGVYIGAQAGWGNTDFDTDEFLSQNGFDDSASQDGVAGRVYIGYQFNQYLGLETGFAAFSDVDLHNDIGEIQTTQWDLLVRIGTPFGDSGFRGDVKLGAAYIMTDFEAGDTAREGDFDDDSNNEIRAVAGASLTYNFCNNISVDVSYLHAFGNPDSDDGDVSAPNTDLVTIGISYLFPIL
jgi:opacity protein-like surface antigen